MGRTSSTRRQRNMSDSTTTTTTRASSSSSSSNSSDARIGGVGGDSDDEDNDELSNMWTYLIRSNQGRVYTNNTLEDDTANHSPDTSLMHVSDIKQQILLASGRMHKNKHYCRPTVAHMLQKRETGSNRKPCFSTGDCSALSTLYIPNTMKRVAGYRNKAFCGTYSKDGNLFLTAAQDQYIRVYDTRNDGFRLIKSIRARDVGWSILDMAFSPDGNYLIYSSWSDSIQFCNIQGDKETHEALRLFPGQSRFCIFSLTFALDNKEILGGANCGCFYIYDRESNQKVLTIEAHDDDVNAVAFADESSQILFSGGDDGLCKVWDRRTLREDDPDPVGVFSGHTNGITYIDSRGDARYLISNSKDQTIKLWDIRRFSTKEGVEATKSAVTAQRWDYRWEPVPRKLARLHHMAAGDSSVMTYRGHSVLHTLIRSKFSPAYTTGQRYIISGCATGNACIYDVLTGKVVKRLTDGHSTCVRDVSWHPTNNVIITTSWDATIGQWSYDGSSQMYDSDDNDSSKESDSGIFRL